MGQEPSIYALYVEGMAALGKQPELVISFELAEAHSTIEWVFQAYNGRVLEDRKGVYEGLIHSCIMEVKQLLKLTLESCGIAHGIWLPVVGSQEVSHKEVEETRDEEDDC